MRNFGDWRPNAVIERLKTASAKREEELQAYREKLRHPEWSQRYRGKYDVCLYFGGFEEPWPLIVFDLNGEEIGRRWYFGPRGEHATYKEMALEIIRHHEEWGPIPEGQEPLIPLEQVRTQ